MSTELCFDVDGVIADHTGNLPYADRRPYPFAAERLRRLREMGYSITLLTARYMRRAGGDAAAATALGYQELKDWCDRHGVPYDNILLGKPAAKVFVDDRAFRLQSDNGEADWESLFEALETDSYKPA